ncbi:hypothetical protein L3X38_004204 [Prunus dulcis]|uniref:F-box family protein with DUF295 n=1 Tax=Prunus dulcis TaxID=3755 RepID=A0AAD4ZNI3_PRUDU|nr:hypothetical protein L3X38_004204 [Prunus dulcis]
MISDGCSPEFTRSSSSIFSFVSPPNQSSKDRVGFDGLRIGVPDTPKSRNLGLGHQRSSRPTGGTYGRSSYLGPPNHHVPTLYLVITQSWTDAYGHPVRFQFTSVHLTFPHEFPGLSDRECQDLRLGRLGVPRPARITARLTLCPRDLPGLRIRMTTVPCILPERLELTWCHRGPVGGSG